MEPNDIAPVAKRFTISEAGSVGEVCDRIGAWLAERPELDWVDVGAHFHAEDLAEGRISLDDFEIRQEELRAKLVV